ncbi:MAG: cytochrome c [Bdellovibrionales bacterium]|nr:cytochrome c [Bdellovibrionales bacterium]
MSCFFGMEGFRLFTIFILALCSWQVGASKIHSDVDSLKIRKDHVDVAEISLADLVTKNTVQILPFEDPIAKKKIWYKVVSLDSVLRPFIKSGPSELTLVEVICADGYRPQLPISVLEHFDGYIAMAREDRAHFALNRSKDGREIKLAPYYLVWKPKKGRPFLKYSPSQWSYQVVGLHLMSAVGAQKNTLPEAKKGGSFEQEGKALFAKHCFSCHALDGVGGQVGPDLLKPLPATERYSSDWLERWINDPQSLRADSKMVGLKQSYPDVKKRRSAAQKILSYLNAL